MSGPALLKKHSHAAIHEAAIHEAVELLDLLATCLERKEPEKAWKVALVLVEHWETRTLRHAEAEEEGLYKKLVEDHPELKDEVTALIRDHQLMRKTVAKIKNMLREQHVTKEMFRAFAALVEIDLLHNEAEEALLME